MAGIFISYRRDDAQGWAGRLSEDLQRSLPGVRIFRDIDTIPAGTPFAEYTVDAVSSCDVLIALIGPRWIHATDERGNRRLDDPEDLTRLEIAAALRRNVTVIPTLVAGAPMPRREDLPGELQPLPARQSFQLDDRAWQDDVRRLVAALTPLLATRRPRRAVPIAMAALAIVVLAIGAYAGLPWFDRTGSGRATQAPPLGPRPTPPGQSQETILPSQDLARGPKASDTPGPTDSLPSSRPSAPPPSLDRRNVERALLDAQMQARAAYTSAVSWLERAEHAAKSARASANEASRASGSAKNAFPTAASYRAAQWLFASVWPNATAAGQAAARAEEAVRRIRNAVTAAETSAKAIASATDPALATRAVSAVAAAEETARRGAADVENEAANAAQAAKATGTEADRAMTFAPGTTIQKVSCAKRQQALYQVALAGDAQGPPTSTLSLHVAGTTEYGFEVDLICTAWRPARRGDGSEDREHCVNGDVGSPKTGWTATVTFRPRFGDIPPHEASAYINDSDGSGRAYASVPLKCQ